MKLATYNVENLFNRASVMNHHDWDVGRTSLTNFSKLNALLGEERYTAARKAQMVTLMVALGLEKDDKGPFVLLRRNRGELLKRPRTGSIEIIANGRADWVGSLELRVEPIEHEAMLNTARVIHEVNADVLAVVEAESRPALKLFSDKILPAVSGTPYDEIMLIDGNDERGIDVGLATRSKYPIELMRSHVHERLTPTSYLFSRDCPEFVVSLPSGKELLVMVNHFKSKGYGSPVESDAKRKAQAARVKEIYEERLPDYPLIAVVGDLNDFPSSDPLKPLHQTSLKDIFLHTEFDNGGYPGTYGLCGSDKNKIDYMFLSPDLFGKVKKAGVFRKGMFPGKQPVRWEVFPQLTAPSLAGSDHACIWAEINV